MNPEINLAASAIDARVLPEKVISPARSGLRTRRCNKQGRAWITKASMYSYCIVSIRQGVVIQSIPFFLSGLGSENLRGFGKIWERRVAAWGKLRIRRSGVRLPQGAPLLKGSRSRVIEGAVSLRHGLHPPNCIVFVKSASSSQEQAVSSPCLQANVLPERPSLFGFS